MSGNLLSGFGLSEYEKKIETVYHHQIYTKSEFTAARNVRTGRSRRAANDTLRIDTAEKSPFRVYRMCACDLEGLLCSVGDSAAEVTRLAYEDALFLKAQEEKSRLLEQVLQTETHYDSIFAFVSMPFFQL